MLFHKLINTLLVVLLLASASIGQKRATGGIKGKVRLESGSLADGVTVIARQGEREAARAATNRKGEFRIKGLPPGRYSLVFRKPGLRVGTFEDFEVQAGKERNLRDGLILPVDEGTLAFVRGSVFNHEGRSVPGARVEIARLATDGTAKKIDGRITGETGSFVFRLVPDTAKYRVTAKVDGKPPVSGDVEVEGPAIYRIALSLTAPSQPVAP